MRFALGVTGVLSVVLVLLAGCGGSGGGGDGSSKPTRQSAKIAETQPQCSALLDDAAWLKQANGPGCRIGKDLQMVASFDCSDGRTLYNFGEGGVTYFGFSNGPLQKQKGDVQRGGSTPYGKAYTACKPK